jgi:hypothetical protein
MISYLSSYRKLRGGYWIKENTLESWRKVSKVTYDKELLKTRQPLGRKFEDNSNQEFQLFSLRIKNLKLWT